MSGSPVSRLFADYVPKSSLTSAQERLENVLIAPAALSDAQAIAPLVAQREGWPLEDALKRVHGVLQAIDDEHLALVAKLDETVIGFAKAKYTRIAPDPAQGIDVPEGWYLSGVIVSPDHRRRGVGLELTRHRMHEIAQRSAREVFYFANSLNRVSIDLHERLGFVEIRRDFKHPGATFSGGGVGLLFRATLNSVKVNEET